VVVTIKLKTSKSQRQRRNVKRGRLTICLHLLWRAAFGCFDDCVSATYLRSIIIYSVFIVAFDVRSDAMFPTIEGCATSTSGSKSTRKGRNEKQMMMGLPNALCDFFGRKDAEDDWIGGRIEWSQTLNKSRNRDRTLSEWNVAVHLQHVPNKVGTPADNERWLIK
jgi:hypothetical protein